MSEALPMKAVAEPQKRTRKNVRQSKEGCFTCRARRKKCGEEKPSCLRCLKAKITCEGYPVLTLPGPRKESESEVESHDECISLQLYRVPRNPRFTRLYALGLELLFEGSSLSTTLAGSSIWVIEVPQISVVNDAVYAAVTCFGSMYEATTLRTGGKGSPEYVRALNHYQLALLKLRSELRTNHGELLPTFVASVLLAVAETLRSHFTDALLHINGAFAFLQQHNSTRADISPDFEISTQPCKSEVGDPPSTSTERLYALARVLDVQIATFALGMPLRLATIAPQTISQISSGHNAECLLQFLSTQVMSIIHSCLHFTSVAAPFKYIARAFVSRDVTMQQCRHIAQVTQWLQLLKQRFVETSKRALLVLQAHCLSTIIYLSTILSPYEAAYDAFQSFFQEIVSAAGSVLIQHPGDSALASPRHRLCLHVSLAQPLFLTATKCRDQRLRQDAIRLLRLTGREGPWHSHIHAEVAQRVFEIEERRSGNLLPAFDPQVSPHDTTYGVPEGSRICGSGVETWPELAVYPRFVSISVSRCVDVDQMLASASTPWDAPENWEIWSEQIALD